jgi:SAM-dependent methyltransferase
MLLVLKKLLFNNEARSVKNYKTILFASLILILASNAPSLARNFENSDEHKDNQTLDETRMTWLSSKYNNNKDLMQKTWEEYYLTTTDGLPKVHIKIRQDDGIKMSFGYRNSAIEDLEQEFLQFVHDLSKHKSPITLEIGAGPGNFSWKPFLTYENHNGAHYANEISHTMMKHEFSDNIREVSRSLNLDISSKIIQLPGSCFDILKGNPELKNKIDAIYVSGVVHFFNPEQHQLFLTLLEELLAPGGQAFWQPAVAHMNPCLFTI